MGMFPENDGAKKGKMIRLQMGVGLRLAFRYIEEDGVSGAAAGIVTPHLGSDCKALPREVLDSG